MLLDVYKRQLMHKDFLDKLVEHGNGQLVEVLILINQSDKTAVSYTHLFIMVKIFCYGAEPCQFI